MTPTCRRAWSMLLLVGMTSVVWAQPDPDDLVQRQRIARERAEVEARFAAREAVCRERFIVTACIDEARAVSGERLDSLRRQEEVLEGNERRRRAAARLESIRQKTEAAGRPRAPSPSADPARAAVGLVSPRPVPQGAAAAPLEAVERDAEVARRAAEAAAARRVVRTRDGARRSAAREAAVARAAAAAQRRDQAAVAEVERQRKASSTPRKSVAPLPPRPAMAPGPSASGP